MNAKHASLGLMLCCDATGGYPPEIVDDNGQFDINGIQRRPKQPDRNHFYKQAGRSDPPQGGLAGELGG